MKNSKRRIIALGMTAVLTLMMVETIPVLAAPTGTVDENGTTTTGNNITNSGSTANVVSSSSATTTVQITNEGSFKVSFPKTITITNSESKGDVTFTNNNDPYIQVVDADLDPNQKLTVAVVDTHDGTVPDSIKSTDPNVSVKNKNGSGNARRYFKIGLQGNVETGTWDVNTPDHSKSFKIENENYASGGQYISGNTEDLKTKIAIKQLEPINAGRWKGTVTFSVTVSNDSDNGTS